MYRDYSEAKKNRKFIEIKDIEISESSRQILEKIFDENPDIKYVFLYSRSYKEVKENLQQKALEHLYSNPEAFDYYKGEISGNKQLDHLSWQDLAAIRILDYLDHDGEEHEDLNLRGEAILNHPFRLLFIAAKEGKGGATEDFFRDMLHLFRQFYGRAERKIPSREKVQEWMDRHPSGLDPEVIDMRKKNKDRIIRLFIKKIDAGDIQRSRFKFEPGLTFWEKYRQMLEWWNDKNFHLQFTARTPERLNRMLDRSLDEETMDTLVKAQNSGIPFFVNPYYLSLLNVDEPDHLKSSDAAIRDYIFVSNELVEEFGNIVAWEKEDQVEPGKPNAAGWVLPNKKNIHRRYPEVAIMIPDTTGRACGGLCVSCQRMYDFQNGHLNFDLEELKPQGSWWERLPRLMKYFEHDSQLRDILITGGDSLMNSDNSLQRILNEVYLMAERKMHRNNLLPDEAKVAEMQRIRLGTRLPVYLPQRVTDNLVAILARFRQKASEVGFKQFVIQTHFESAMEVTPESAEAVRKLISAGWIVTNQLVFTAAASRRGHTAKLRKVLNDIGIITYYTFTVKGFKENSFQYANNARAIQERMEEKYVGEVPEVFHDLIKEFPNLAAGMVENIESIRQVCKVPFLATDRNVMNLPGVGKSLTFRTIGLTYDGRRILEFNHDETRTHSPIIDQMGKVVIIESRSISNYLARLEAMNEDMKDYTQVWGYSIGETEPRTPVFNYPKFDYEVTEKITNLEI